MRQRPLLLCLLLIGFAACAVPSSITYGVSVDTSSIAGTAGSFDFNFNPGPLGSQAASVQILNFTSDGTLDGIPALIGDVSGLPIPGPVTFDNGTGFNDYFEAFTFGRTLSFDLSLYGPALSTPDGFSTSGSTFAFSMFSDATGTIPTLTSNVTAGFVFTVDVNLDGTTTVSDFSSQTSVTSETSSVPESSSLVLVGTTIGVLGMLGFKRGLRNTAAV